MSEEVVNAVRTVLGDLTEQMARLREVIERHEQLLTTLTSTPSPPQEYTQDTASHQNPSNEEETSAAVAAKQTSPSDPDHRDDGDSGQAPTFILYFDAGSPEEDAELRALDEWVSGVLIPTYVHDVNDRRPWCSRWWEHPEAVAQLHALWLAWLELTDPDTGGHTGPSVWHRDHLDDVMARLRSPEGPFRACMIDPRNPAHRPNVTTPITRYPGVEHPPESTP